MMMNPVFGSSETLCRFEVTPPPNIGDVTSKRTNQISKIVSRKSNPLNGEAPPLLPPFLELAARAPGVLCR